MLSTVQSFYQKVTELSRDEIVDLIFHLEVFLLGKEDIQNEPKILSVTEYAQREGISRQTALWRVKQGKVKAEKVGKQWIIISDEPK